MSRLLCSTAVLALLACGGSQDEANEPKGDDRISLGDRPDSRRSGGPGTDDDADDGMEVEGLKGHLSQYDINRIVQKHARKIDRCYTGKLAGRKYLGGEIEIKYVVNRDGTVKSIVIAKSNLGEWDMERCLRDAAMAMKFPKPKGGEAEFSVPLTFTTRRPAVWWGDDQTTTEVSEKTAALAECAEKSSSSAPPDLWITAYVGNRGVIKSVGFAAPAGGLTDEWAGCAEELVKTWELSDPRGRIAKISFRFPGT